MHKNYQGFGVVGVLLVVIVIGVAGAAGYFVYHKNKEKPVAHSTSHSTPTSPATTRPAEQPAAEGSLTSAAAKSLVAELYDKYAKLGPVGVTDVERALLEKYATSKVLTYFDENQHGTDPVLCAQMLPDNISIVSSTMDQAKATVLVNEKFGSDIQQITVSVVDQNGLKIDGVQCPSR